LIGSDCVTGVISFDVCWIAALQRAAFAGLKARAIIRGAWEGREESEGKGHHRVATTARRREQVAPFVEPPGKREKVARRR
jgi:hypothetical protein